MFPAGHWANAKNTEIHLPWGRTGWKGLLFLWGTGSAELSHSSPVSGGTAAAFPSPPLLPASLLMGVLWAHLGGVAQLTIVTSGWAESMHGIPFLTLKAYDLRGFTYRNKNSKQQNKASLLSNAEEKRGKSENTPWVPSCPNFASALKERSLLIGISHFWVEIWYCKLLDFVNCFRTLPGKTHLSRLLFSPLLLSSEKDQLFLGPRAHRAETTNEETGELGPGFPADSFRGTAL